MRRDRTIGRSTGAKSGGADSIAIGLFQILKRSFPQLCNFTTLASFKAWGSRTATAGLAKHRNTSSDFLQRESVGFAILGTSDSAEVGVKSAEFEDWLTGIARLSPAQRRQALEALCEAKEVDEGAAPDPGGSGETRQPGAWPAKATRGRRASERRVREDALGAVGHGKVERQGCPHCGGRDIVAWGRGERCGALSLQELRAHLQPPDQDADGATAHKGALARSRPGDDRGNQRGEGRRALRCPCQHGVPLVSPFSRLARLGQAQDVDWNCRGGRDVHPGPVQGPTLRSSPPPRKRGGKAEQPPACSSRTFPSS